MLTIQCGKQTQEIPSARINLLIPAADMALAPPLTYPGVVCLDFEVTHYHATRVQTLHPEFATYWTLFMNSCIPVPDLNYPVTAERIRQMGIGAIHVLGLIDLSLKLQDRHCKIGWIHPETYLHPGWQVALGDLALVLTSRR